MKNQLEFLKWLALAAMTLDHYGKIVDPSVNEPTHAIGHLAYPLFAWVLASRLTGKKELAAKYLVWLLSFAVLSQPVFVIAGKTWMQWKIMFTLFFGVVAYLGIDAARNRRVGLAGAQLAVAVSGSVFAEYGFFGVMLIPALIYCLQRGQDTALVALAPLSLAANITFPAPHFSSLDWFAALTAPAVYLARVNRISIPCMPKLFFYVYYPGHIYAFHVLDLYVL